MLKIYRMPNGMCFQFEEGKQPRGAVEIEADEPAPARKARTAANKARKAATK